MVIGFSIGMLGVGGVFLTPVLILTANLDISSAMGTALPTFMGTGLLGSYIYHREGNIKWGYVVYLVPFSILGSLIGSNLNLTIKRSTLEIILGIFLIFMSILIYINNNTTSLSFNKKNNFSPVFYMGIGLLTGFSAGLFGVGGPVLMVPVLNFLGWPLLYAVGVSQVVSFFAALFGSINYFINGKTVVSVAVFVLAAEMVGVWGGGKAAHRIDKKWLVVFLCLVLAVLGIYFMRS